MSVLANVWSFISTLVRSLRSLFALFSFRRRASDPFSLPTANRDALARAHSRLRPILLTPRSIAVSPAYYAQRDQSTRTHSATSTLFAGHINNATASASVPQSSEPQRNSPKLDPHDAELDLPIASCELPELPAASATSFRECTPDTSGTGSLYVLPLTPPDRCYLAPIPSAADCPYTEPWLINVPLDRAKNRLPPSPLKLSVNRLNTDSAFPEPRVVPIGSPPPGRWSPVQVWTSTPGKNDSLAPDSFGHQQDTSSALANLSHAIISRSQSSIRPYDDVSNSSLSSDASPSADYASGPTRERHRAQALIPRSRDQPFPRFHHPDAYACTWRRLPTRQPGKPDRARSHVDIPASEWYDADAYAPSPLTVLSPPPCEFPNEEVDEDEMPLGRLRERLVRQSVGLGVAVPLGAGTRKAAGISPHTRRMSEGCLLAISEGTPTRVGVGVRSDRQAFSMALDGDGYRTKDWLEALSLRFPSEQRDAPEPHVAAPSIEVVAV